MEKQQESSIDIKESSFRGGLVKMVLEHFINLKLWEPIEVGPLGEELAQLFRSTLAFETRVELNDDPTVIGSGILAGKVHFIHEPLGNEPPKPAVISFEVLPTVF